VLPDFNAQTMDLSVQPGNNFYQYANGGWMKNNPLPDDAGRYGTFDKLREDNQKKVKNLLLEASTSQQENGSSMQQIGAFYATGMDTLQIEQQGLQPLQEELQNIKDVKNSADLQKLIAHFHNKGIATLFHFYGSPDKKNSEWMIAQLAQGGLGLTDRDYYLAKDSRSQKIKSEYLIHLKKMFALMGYSEEEAQTKAEVVMKVETRLAQASMTRLQRRDPHKTYNKKNLEELQKLTPQLDWNLYLKEIHLDYRGDFNVAQPEFFGEVNQMLKEVPLSEWKDYLQWKLIRSAAPYLPKAFVDQSFAFYGKILSGNPKIKPRWKRVLEASNSALGEAIGKEFVQRHFPPEAKTRMVTLVHNLRLAMKDRIQNLAWMSETTKEKALEKLQAINVKIGYPEKFRDYSSLEIDRKSYLENVWNAKQFNIAYKRAKIGKKVDKSEWFMTPQTVNAYYSPQNNEIVFPAAILQPPFFYLDADDAVNYGAIGVVIGHEMTHGFDDKGRLYDKNGNLNTWWTKEDGEQFNERTQVLVDQYNSFIVLDTVHANGKLSLGENIADLGGLNISYTAFQKANSQNPGTETIDGFTPDQRFFLAYARIWAQNIRDAEILRRTKEDVHSLGKYRVNGPLVHMPEFYKAFGIQEQAPMFKPQKDRAIIW
jgi:putative endopeptidase